MSLDDLDGCLANFSTAEDGVISTDEWANFVESMGGNSDSDIEVMQSYKSIKRACKIKGKDMSVD